MWKGVFIGSAVVAAAGAGWWAYQWGQIKDQHQYLCDHGQSADGCTTNMSKGAITRAEYDAAVQKGNDHQTQERIGMAVLGVGVVVAGVAFYKGFIAKPSQESRQSASKDRSKRGKRVRRERFVVTPIVSPDGGGATVRLDW